MLPAFGAAAKDDFPAPPGSKLGAVADDMKYEGMRLNIRRFDVELTVEQVLAFYREQWEERYVENDMPPWLMISKKEGDRFFTVQVQPSGPNSSWGYLGISDLPQVLEQGGKLGGNKKRFPMMSGSVVINDLASSDIGRSGRTLLINNGYSVQGNANYYRDHYKSKGWMTVIDQSADAATNHVLLFQSGSSSVSLTIDTGEQGTNIVVNEVNNSLF
jgi:hypothetical protein